MSNEKQHSSLPRWSRRIGWTFLVLLFLIAFLRLSLKTSFVQNWAKNVIVSTANQQLNAELSINRLSGDLWKEVTVSGIYLMQDDTVAQIDTVHAEYNIWALWDGEIKVSRLDVYRPRVMLRQQGGKWNVQDIVAESEDTTTSGGVFPFKIDDLVVESGHISVESDSLPVESNFVVEGLAISSSVAYTSESFDIDLRDLSFQLINTNLDQPLRVQTAANTRQDKVTLEKLVLATGNSMIQSSGYASPVDSSVHLELSANPVSWKDIASYARDFPLRRNLQIDLDIQGQPEKFEISLAMEADGLESFDISSRFQWHSGLVLQHIQAKADYIDAATLFSDTTLPSVQHLSAEFSGRVDLANYQQGKGDLKFSADNLSRSPYHLNAVSGNGSLDGPQASLEINIQQGEQVLTTNLEAEQIWSDLPTVQGDINVSNLNPAYWMQDTTYAGDLSFQSEFSGRGWYPREKLWEYSLQMRKGDLMGQPIMGLSARGKLGSSTMSIDGQAKIREGSVDVKARLTEIAEHPRYMYNLETRNLDVGALMGREDFKTAFNSKISGQGRGFNPATMQLTTSVDIDSSIVNGELIRNLSADFSIQDTVAAVDSARLQSTIAEGMFSFRMNMLHHYDSKNELSLDLLLKDLDALSPLAGVKDLQAEGTVTGKLTPIKNENLRLLGTLDLSDLKYNQLFTAQRAQGSVDLRTQQGLAYLADLDLTAPTFSGVQLQDLTLMTQGNYEDAHASGRYQFRFSSPNQGRIEQGGTYTLKKDSAVVRTTEFNIISSYRTLTLEQPFTLSYRDDTLRMDTMRVSSGDGAYLEVAIPVISSNEQRGYISGQALNTAVIQSSLLGKSYLKGMLSGRFNIQRKDTSLQANGELLLSDVTYQETSFDSLLVTGQVENERLKGKLSLRHEGHQLVDGDANLPFKLGDPEDLPPSFFDQPVKGNLRVRDITIDRFQSLFAEAGITQTSGTFSFHGTLEGRAGEPEFTADASLRNAQLSGVAVDSVTAGFNYRHEDEELQLDASVMSLQQKAVQIDARFPLFINMKTFRVDLPQSQDSIAVDVATNNFNLKALNDFLDRRTLRQVAGQLNGMVHVTGTMGDLKTDGKLALKNGAFRLVPAGIYVDDIQSTINFDPNQVRLTNFSARSGKGSMKANGKVELEKLMPDGIDIKVSAKNFRAANTSQYNAVVNMDARAQGSITKPKITGDLSFISGFLKLQNFGEKSVETIELDSVEERGPSVSIYDSLALDVDLSFNRRFYIRNQRYLEMEIELDGNLDLLKDSGGDLQLFGTMSAPSGYARPFGKEFVLQEGVVTFSGPPDNPRLMIRTRYEPPQTQQEIVIWYVIEGTVEKPNFRYESQPPMELQNIVSYTLFGQPFYALDSWKQVVAGSGSNTTAADVALDVLLDRVEALATQKLGIDVVKIDNSPVGGETGTSITTGWYLNPKVFFAIQNVITGSAPDTGFLLEYMLRENLKLILRQGNGIRQGVDVKWNYDY